MTPLQRSVLVELNPPDQDYARGLSIVETPHRQTHAPHLSGPLLNSKNIRTSTFITLVYSRSVPATA
jgi:hypothetical protein